MKVPDEVSKDLYELLDDLSMARFASAKDNAKSVRLDQVPPNRLVRGSLSFCNGNDAFD